MVRINNRTAIFIIKFILKENFKQKSIIMEALQAIL